MNRRARSNVMQKQFVPATTTDANQLKDSEGQTATPQKLPQTPKPLKTPTGQVVQHKPILIEEIKTEPEEEQGATSVAAGENDIIMQVDDGTSNNAGGIFVRENEKLPFKKIFLNRKKPSVRIREKRIRTNRQLRKAILPRNALMSLNEVKGVDIGEFTVVNSPECGLIATVTVNNKQYEGRGPTKSAAKNNASEKALRDYILEKLRQCPRKPRGASAASHNPVEQMDTTETNDNGEDANGDNNSVKDNEEVEEVPMINLASFAIYKLFAEWKNEGYVVPDLIPSSTGSGGEDPSPEPTKSPKKPTQRTELPPDWESMHPASLLCLMRPGLHYVDLGPLEDGKAYPKQRIAVTVDDVQYVGTANSKKLARRRAAATVCNTLFNTNIPVGAN